MIIGAFEQERSPQGCTVVVMIHSNFMKKWIYSSLGLASRRMAWFYGLLCQGSKSLESMNFPKLEWPVRLEQPSKLLCAKGITLVHDSLIPLVISSHPYHWMELFVYHFANLVDWLLFPTHWQDSMPRRYDSENVPFQEVVFYFLGAYTTQNHTILIE